jgi:hypothetical protein
MEKRLIQWFAWWNSHWRVIWSSLLTILRRSSLPTNQTKPSHLHPNYDSIVGYECRSISFKFLFGCFHVWIAVTPWSNEDQYFDTCNDGQCWADWMKGHWSDTKDTTNSEDSVCHWFGWRSFIQKCVPGLQVNRWRSVVYIPLWRYRSASSTSLVV